MKKIKGFIVSVDSVIDVITNSSSELFIARTSKSVETVKEILLEILGSGNPKLSVRENFAKQNAFGTVINVGENFDLFLDEYLSLNEGYGFLNYQPLAACFVGDVNELNWEIRNDGTFRKGRDWRENIYSLADDHPRQVDYLKTEAYQRDKREEFIANNSNAEVMEKLKGFVFIQSESDNSIPYDIWDTINATFNGQNWHLG